MADEPKKFTAADALARRKEIEAHLQDAFVLLQAQGFHASEVGDAAFVAGVALLETCRDRESIVRRLQRAIDAFSADDINKQEMKH